MQWPIKIATISTAIIGGWLLFSTREYSMLSVLSRYQLFRHFLAYLLIIEVAKLSNGDSSKVDLTMRTGDSVILKGT